MSSKRAFSAPSATTPAFTSLLGSSESGLQNLNTACALCFQHKQPRMRSEEDTAYLPAPCRLSSQQFVPCILRSPRRQSALLSHRLGTHKLLALLGCSPAGSMPKTDPPLYHLKPSTLNSLGKCVCSSASSYIRTLIQTCWLNVDEGSEHWISLYKTWIA